MSEKQLSWNEYVRLCLSYTTFSQDEDGSWLAEVKPLPGCNTFGDSRAAAAFMAEDAIHGWLVTALRFGDDIPAIDGFHLVYLDNASMDVEFVHA